MTWSKGVSGFAVLLTLVAVAGCGGAPEGNSALYFNGRIFTMADAAPWAEAVLVEDGRIKYVGSNEQARLKKPDRVPGYDLDGRLLLPGFIDTHAHPVMGATMLESLQLNPMESQEQWLQDIAEYAEDNADLPFIFGMGVYAKKFGPQGPSKAVLDEIEPNRPVLIADEGGHTAWANSAALKMAGITNSTPDPIPGKHYFQRDANGEPTGFLVEHLAWMPVAEKIGAISLERVLPAAKELMPLLSMFGITTVFEAGMLSMVDVGHSILSELETDGALNTRMYTSVSVVDASQASTAVAEIQRLNKAWASELIAPTTIKVHNDGTTEAETSAQFAPYLNDPDNRGAMILSGQPLAEMVIAAARAGVHVHIHSIGERAVHEALNAFEAARRAVPESRSRFSTAHTELIQPSDVPRFAALDVVAQTTPVWFPAGDYEGSIEILGRERSERKYRFRGVLESGGRVTFGSDFPVGGGLPALRPLVNIAVGMSRSYSGEPATGHHVPELLSVEEMIRGYTLDAAYQLGAEKEIGSIEVGKRADFVILIEDIFEQSPAEIPDNRVAMTVMNGEVVYQRGIKSWIAEWFLDI